MMQRLLKTLLPALLLVLMLWGVSAGEENPIVQYQPFPLSQVRLTDGYIKDLMETNAKYLFSLDSDRLLHMFRITAGLSSTARPLGGWEAPGMEIRGHTLGHYLSACALLYASTGDEAIKAKADAIVVELAKCQAQHGNGYLSAFPESFFDRLEAGQSVWVPWYTMHKIFAGLYDMYVYAGNELAFDVLLKLTDWAYNRLAKFNNQQMAAILNVEFGGMNEVLYNIYGLTQDPKHLELAQRFDHKAIFTPLAAGRDQLAGLHANTQIPKIVGAARRYELTGDREAMAIASNFWQIVVGTRSYVTGGNSVNEHFGRANELAFTLSNTNHETCNTYNMLRLTRHLFEWTGDVKYADYYERAFFNGILSTMHPETGMKMYFVPMGTGFFKVFHTHDNSFYCCTGTGMESFAKLGDSIYFHHDNELYVNMFIASVLDWPELGVQIEQKTNYPWEQGTTLIIHSQGSVEMPIYIRVPYWAVNGVTVKINGNVLDITAEPASYLKLEQVWHDQDIIEINVPMSLHSWPLPDKPDRVAFLYGPLVLCGLLGTENMQVTTTGVSVTIPNRVIKPTAYIQVPEAEWTDVAAWLLPVEDEELTFITREDVGNIVFKPFFLVFDQRYGIYWDLSGTGRPNIDEPRDEPILWYTFDQTTSLSTVTDSSGLDHHGLLLGGAKIVEGGVSQGALKLDGMRGYVRLPDGILQNIEQVTICTWVYLNQNRTWARIFDFGSGTGINMFLTPQAASNPVLRFAITTSGASGESIFGGRTALPTGQWVHVAVVLDGTKATMYMNGKVVALSNNIYTYPWEMGKTTQNYIGRSQYSSDPYLDGLIDDFRIYNRALDQDEIQAIFQQYGGQ